MKKTLAFGLSGLLLCSYALASGQDSLTADEDAERIVRQVDRILGLDDIRCKQRMIVHRSDGSVRTYVMNVMTSGSDKAFAEIIEPPREKGRQMLKLGEAVWSYLPSVKKSIRVSGRSRFMGGDFENNDILRLDLVDDYIPRIAEESPEQYILDLKGKDLSLTYAGVKIWVSKKDFQPIKQEYYTINGQLIKSAVFGEVGDFGGLRRPGVIEMHSALSPKKKTVLELIDFRKGVNNPPEVFTRSNLGK